MNGAFAWLLILVLIGGAWLYIEFTPKDVDPYFVTHQASMSTTNIAGESAVYRSLANEHGRALLGSMSPLNRFSLFDLWDDVETFRLLHVSQAGRIQHLDNVPALVARVQDAISGHPQGGEIKMAFGVSAEALIAFLAIVLSGRVPRLAPPPDADAEASVDVDDDAVLYQAEFRLAEGVGGIMVRKDSDTSVLVPLFGQAPAHDAHDRELARKGVASQVPAEAVRIGSCNISQVDFGVAIAGQLTALGAQYRWCEADTVLMAPGPLSVYSLVAMLTALSAKGQVAFAEVGPLMSAQTLLHRVHPTVLVSDDETMRTLVKQTDNFTALTWLDYALRRARLAKGALTRNGMLPGFRGVRLVHTSTGANPYQWLDNGEIASLHVLSGTQIIHTYTPGDALPVAQTVVGDYRSAKRLPGVVLGPPLPGLELKTALSHLEVRRANHTKWEPIDVKSSVDARLGRDGCLYIPAKRHDFSDYYFYTGELK